jgi:hypothetical protein
MASDFPPPLDDTKPHKTLAPRRRRIDSDSSSSRSTSSSNPSHQVIKIHPTSLTDDPKYRRLEMRLIYHYTTMTSHELLNAGQDDKERIWAAVVPRFGFESDLVLDGILAFSALHLHALSPNDLEVAEARTKYLVKALDSHRKAVAHIESCDHSQVFMTALFIFHYTGLQSTKLKSKNHIIFQQNVPFGSILEAFLPFTSVHGPRLLQYLLFGLFCN